MRFLPVFLDDPAGLLPSMRARGEACLNSSKALAGTILFRLRQAGLSVNVVPGVAAASGDPTEILEIAA